ncbi:unnamed protein product [Cylicostephanus goldi]|uniref:HMG box domain-containing protein n=1 Tax=Cylicostephanus goldi TaxID=71465 RepID=A0A3P7NGB8_CYLGO|nr:unnamed protein product [Cylicostephanus goldi]
MKIKKVLFVKFSKINLSSAFQEGDTVADVAKRAGEMWKNMDAEAKEVITFFFMSSSSPSLPL